MLRLVALILLGFLCSGNAFAESDDPASYGSIMSSCGEDRPRLEIRRLSYTNYDLLVHNSQSTPALSSALSEIAGKFEWFSSAGCRANGPHTFHEFFAFRELETTPESEDDAFLLYPDGIQISKEVFWIWFVHDRPLSLHRGEALMKARCLHNWSELCVQFRGEPWPSNSHPVRRTDISGDPEFFRKHTYGPFQLQWPDDETDE